MVDERDVLISVIIPLYNKAATVSTTLKSLAAQSYQNWELIIVNDGSTDNSAEQVQLFSSQMPMKYFEKQNGGVCSARNYGVQKARGSYVVFLDADDIAERTWLAAIAQKIAETNADIVFCGCNIIKGEKSENVMPALLGKFYNSITGIFLAGTFCVKRALFLAVGGYDEVLKFSENYELGMRLLMQKVTTTSINEALVSYYNDATERTSNSIDNRLNANRYILQKYRDTYKKDIPYFSGLMSMTGYLLAQKKQKKEAMAFYLKCLVMRPFYLKNLYRILFILK